MTTQLIAIDSVKFYWEQYKTFKTYEPGTKFTLIRYNNDLRPTSAKVVAPGGLVGTICTKTILATKIIQHVKEV